MEGLVAGPHIKSFVFLQVDIGVFDLAFFDSEKIGDPVKLYLGFYALDGAMMDSHPPPFPVDVDGRPESFLPREQVAVPHDGAVWRESHIQ